MRNPPENILLYDLRDAADLPLAEAGGKAYNLASLLRAGFHVPAGFVLLASARQLDRQSLERLISPLQADHQQHWAVRSSAVEEDSGFLSHAGQYATFLDVKGQDLPALIEACWRSLQASSAAAYRASQSLPISQPGMAVIIQKMVGAKSSGVAFSADPTTGERDAVWIEMNAGVGSQVVDGSIRPARVKVSRPTGNITPLTTDAALPLSTPAIAKLAKLTLDVEALFGDAQDIEWAYDGQTFWLLQARPVTSDLSAWTRANIGEVMPEVITPLTWSIFKAHLTGKPDGDENVVRLIQGKAYLKRSALLRSFDWLVWADPLTVSRALGLEQAAPAAPPRRSLAAYGASLLFILENLGITRRLESRIDAFLHEKTPPEISSGSNSAQNLLASIEAWSQWTESAFRLHLYTTTYAIGAMGLLLRASRGVTGSDDFTGMTGGLFTSKSTEISQRLWELAAAGRSDGLAPVLSSAKQIEEIEAALMTTIKGKTWLDKFHSLQNEYGDRSENEFELSTPRWREDCAYLLNVVKEYLNRDSPPAYATKKPAPISSGSFKWWLLQRFLSHSNRFAALRETMKHEVIKGYGALRALYLELAHLLAQHSRLEKPEDIFFLTRSDVATLAGGAGHDFIENIRLRQTQWQRYRAATNPPAVVNNSYRHVLSGIGCSPGVVKGKARVIFKLDTGLNLQPDEILIVPQADPAWTPLFLCSAAVISEMGGFLSHSATVARELGIPAVFGVSGITSHITTGDTVLVDGKKGLVEILSANIQS